MGDVITGLPAHIVTDEHVTLEKLNPDMCARGEFSRGIALRHREVAARMKPTRRRLTIMSTLATGWLPWGVQWHPHMTLLGREYSLCCGHVMRRQEAQAFVDAGLLGLDREDGQWKRPVLHITPAGRIWLRENWR